MNKKSAIYEEFSIKEVLVFLCENARKNNKISDLSGSDLSYSDLSGSNLSYSDLSGSNLSYSDLSGSNLSYSDLSGSNLSGSDLSYSDLSGSDLSYSDLSGSNLSGSNLSGSNLSGSNFDFSILNFSCKGIGLNFDDRTIKQLMNHALKQNNKNKVYNEIRQAILNNPEWYAWLESWHRKNEVANLKDFVIEMF